jgi:hypothetical protein
MTDVVTLQQAKDFLNISSTDADAEIPFYIKAAQRVWANRGGPLGSTASPVDEWHDGGGEIVVTRLVPISSVQLVAETTGSSAQTLTEADPGTSSDGFAYSVDLESGTFIRRTGGRATAFARGVRNIHIQYTPGYDSVPEDIQEAVLLLVKHMWDTQRGIGRRPGTGGDEPVPGSSFSWPRRVEEILVGYTLPGIA